MNTESTIPVIQESHTTRKAYGRAIASALLSFAIGFFTFSIQFHSLATRGSLTAMLLALLLGGFVFWRVLVLKTLGKIMVTTLIWGIAWGLVATIVGIIMFTINPGDFTGPIWVVLVWFGAPSAVFGLFAGFLFATALAIAELRVKLGSLWRGSLAP